MSGTSPPDLTASVRTSVGDSPKRLEGADVVEHLVVGLVERETVAESIPAIGGGGLAGVICVAVILFVAMIPFFAFRNVSRVLGPGRLHAMLFGTAVKATEDQ
jgi:hypothetical protein